MPIRIGPWARSFAARFDPEQSLLVYSMWEGYLERDPELKNFVESQTWTRLHASGHGSPSQIKDAAGMVQGMDRKHRQRLNEIKLACGQRIDDQSGPDFTMGGITM